MSNISKIFVTENETLGKLLLNDNKKNVSLDYENPRNQWKEMRFKKDSESLYVKLVTDGSSRFIKKELIYNVTNTSTELEDLISKELTFIIKLANETLLIENMSCEYFSGDYGNFLLKFESDGGFPKRLPKGSTINVEGKNIVL